MKVQVRKTSYGEIRLLEKRLDAIYSTVGQLLGVAPACR